jgi:hypothetical protein
VALGLAPSAQAQARLKAVDQMLPSLITDGVEDRTSNLGWLGCNRWCRIMQGPTDACRIGTSQAGGQIGYLLRCRVYATAGGAIVFKSTIIQIIPVTDIGRDLVRSCRNNGASATAVRD